MRTKCSIKSINKTNYNFRVKFNKLKLLSLTNSHLTIPTNVFTYVYTSKISHLIDPVKNKQAEKHPRQKRVQAAVSLLQ